MPVKKKKKRKINLEIERKFLMKCVPTFGKKKVEHLAVTQFYFNKAGQRLRYRQIIDESGKKTYYSTQKKFISNGINDEEEFEISERKYRRAFSSYKDKKYIIKKRSVFKYKNLKFEIDKYAGMDLVVMEVELKDINQKIYFPKFIKNQIIIEVTMFKEFGNFNLAENV